VGVGDGEALGLADGDALGLADPDGLALGDADGVALPLGAAEALDDGLALDEVLLDGVGVECGASATGRDELFGRTAKNLGGRLKVGTSSQKGACGSSEK
jgi:hypothetical protein